MKVPWAPKKDLAAKASEVLEGYRDMVGHSVNPPIPVEDIIRCYLGVKLGVMAFDENPNMAGVLGATYVEPRLICINKRLLEDRSEGRMIFTCAHEAGHWVLHRWFVDEAKRFGSQNDAIICRTANAKQPIEWQADYFAACLLMPEDEMRDAFRAACDTETLVLNNVKSSFGGTSVCIDPCVQNWHWIAHMVREAGRFTNVSKQAMIIRMLDLGLVVNLTGVQMGWNASYAH